MSGRNYVIPRVTARRGKKGAYRLIGAMMIMYGKGGHEGINDDGGD